jgi:hypothetical protein
MTITIYRYRSVYARVVDEQEMIVFGSSAWRPCAAVDERQVQHAVISRR